MGRLGIAAEGYSGAVGTDLRGVASQRFMAIGIVSNPMSDVLRTPTRRSCERCERTERTDGEGNGWQVTEDGDIRCIHEWDIDGDFVPVQEGSSLTAAKEC